MATLRKHAEHHALVRALLHERGRTFVDEAGIDLEKNTPAVLFQHLYMSLLLSARISAEGALEATRALIEAGLTTPEKMAKATWQQRVDVITWHGYKRYDERTSTMLGDTAALVLDKYKRDLRNLRDAAGRDADQKVIEAAKRLGLPGSAEELSKLVPRKDFARLTAALNRTALAKDYEHIVDHARS